MLIKYTVFVYEYINDYFSVYKLDLTTLNSLNLGEMATI